MPPLFYRDQHMTLDFLSTMKPTFLLATMVTASAAHWLLNVSPPHPPVAAIEPVTLVQNAATSARMPIYITPYYNSDPLQVRVGPHSEALTSATAASAGELAAQLKQERATLPIETM